MSTNKFKIRFKNGGKTADYTDGTSDTHFYDALSSIQEKISLPEPPYEGIRFIYGAPATKHVLSSDITPTTTLGDLSIKSGEMIRIENIQQVISTLAEPSTTSTSLEPSTNVDNLPKVLVGRQRIINDDNSCIFNAIAHGCSPTDPLDAQTLRTIVANTIQGDPVTYTDVVLDMPRATYITKIQNPDYWGGSTELTILSQFFEIEIYVWNIELLSPIIYGDDKHYQRRIILFYNGLHYDTFVQKLVSQSEAQVKAPKPQPHAKTDAASKVSDFAKGANYEEGEDNEQNPVASGVNSPLNPFRAVGLAKEDITPFSVSDTKTIEQSKVIAQYLQLARYHMNLSKDQVICQVCQAICDGSKAAQKHAEKTGHQQFAQI